MHERELLQSDMLGKSDYRKAAHPPDISLNGTYLADLPIRYFADYFTGRSAWIRLDLPTGSYPPKTSLNYPNKDTMCCRQRELAMYAGFGHVVGGNLVYHFPETVTDSTGDP